MPSFGDQRGQSGGQRGRGGLRGRGRGGSRGGRGLIAPKLPALLREQMAETYGTTDKKDRRKHYDHAPKSKGPAGRPRRDAIENQDQDEEPRAGPSRPSAPAKSTKTKNQSSTQTPPKKKKKKELTLPNANPDDAEDGEIEWLEYALRNEKGKGKEDESDGLDDLLDFADLLGPGGAGLKRGRGEESDDDEDSLDLDGDDDEDGPDLDDDDDDDDGSEQDEDVDSEMSDEDEEEADNDDENDGINLDEDDSDAEGGTSAGTKQAAPAAPATKYVPPHLRAAQLAEKAQGSKEKALDRQKLERKTQGLLNKLSEANMESIISSIEELYRDNSRNDVTTTITDLVLQVVSDKANLLDSFVSLYATFVGALHRIIGIEFGAHFLHTLIIRYKNPTNTSVPAATIYETPDASKESLNLLTLVAELYNAGVVGPKLIYDLIRGFIDAGLGEQEVEALLKVVKRCGSQLRSEDPGSLKDITNLVTEKTKNQDMTVRTKFMLETLTSLKSAKKEPNRFLSSLGKKRRLLTHEPLRVSLDDLLQSDTRGKWWLVGAGWQGNPLLEVKPVERERNDDSLIELAREQGMNTDVRRSIFVILMTSEDYVHACDRMSHLKYTETQQREFIRVALHCCNLEKVYNPYYTLVLNHLCSESYNHRFTLQYALWDLLRGDVGSNVAKAMAYIIARGSMDLTVFKAIDFTSLKKSLVSFFKSLLAHTILATQTTSPLFVIPPTRSVDKEVIQELFEKTLANPELAQGLAYVISRYGAKIGTGEGLDERRMGVVKKGLDIGKKVLSRAV